MDIVKKGSIREGRLALARTYISRLLENEDLRRLVNYVRPIRHKSYIQFFFEHMASVGAELLKDDMDFIWSRCRNMKNREVKPYLSSYKRIWLDHMQNSLSHQKQNKGRVTANLYLLDALPERTFQEFKSTVNNDVITNDDIESHLNRTIESFNYDVDELLRVYKQYVPKIDNAPSNCLNCGYNGMFCIC